MEDDKLNLALCRCLGEGFDRRSTNVAVNACNADRVDHCICWRV